MKKLLIAAGILALSAGMGSAADMRMPVKAQPPVVAALQLDAASTSAATPATAGARRPRIRRPAHGLRERCARSPRAARRSRSRRHRASAREPDDRPSTWRHVQPGERRRLRRRRPDRLQLAVRPLLAARPRGRLSGKHRSRARRTGCSVASCAARIVLPGSADARAGVVRHRCAAGSAGCRMSDRVLLYATGGLAYGHLESDYAERRQRRHRCGRERSTTRAGWTAGAGVEGAIDRNWTVKLEYLYMDLGDFGNGSSSASARPTSDHAAVRVPE